MDPLCSGFSAFLSRFLAEGVAKTVLEAGLKNLSLADNWMYQQTRPDCRSNLETFIAESLQLEVD